MVEIALCFIWQTEDLNTFRFFIHDRISIGRCCTSFSADLLFFRRFVTIPTFIPIISRFSTIFASIATASISFPATVSVTTTASVTTATATTTASPAIAISASASTSFPPLKTKNVEIKLTIVLQIVSCKLI